MINKIKNSDDYTEKFVGVHSKIKSLMTHAPQTLKTLDKSK